MISLMRCSILMLLFSLIIPSGYTMSNDSIMHLMPNGDSALTIESEQVIVTDKAFYDYINGAAELYLKYGFQKLGRRSYLLEDKDELKVEVYDMGAPENAFGVFSYSKDTANLALGQGGQYMAGSLIFWQDRYFVSIFAHRETKPIKEQMHRIAEHISQAIGQKKALPTFFHVTPKQERVEGSLFYFTHHAWQNKYGWLANENIFRVDQHTRALLAQYGPRKDRYLLFVVEYPTPREAKKARKKGLPKLNPQLGKHRLVRTSDSRWMGYKMKDRLLVFVYRAPSQKKVSGLLEQTVENYSGKP